MREAHPGWSLHPAEVKWGEEVRERFLVKVTGEISLNKLQLLVTDGIWRFSGEGASI